MPYRPELNEVIMQCHGVRSFEEGSYMEHERFIKRERIEQDYSTGVDDLG